MNDHGFGPWDDDDHVAAVALFQNLVNRESRDSMTWFPLRDDQPVRSHP